MVPDILKLLNKPEYWWQPTALLRRLFATNTTMSSSTTLVKLPWGLSIEVDPNEAIGRSLSHHGIFDISAVETMFRLIDPDETVLDIGANIGFMSAVALVANEATRVISFEPHPVLFDRLSRNRNIWMIESPDICGRISLEPYALSDSRRMSSLYIGDGFSTNQGIASLENVPSDDTTRRQIPVQCVALDEYFGESIPAIGFMKIDVEGHEYVALTGAHACLASGRVRDILFEDHIGMSSDVCSLLRKHGYTIYFVAKLPWGPWLDDSPKSIHIAKSLSSDSPNFLATLAPERAIQRMSGIGFRCLGKKVRVRVE